MVRNNFQKKYETWPNNQRTIFPLQCKKVFEFLNMPSIVAMIIEWKESDAKSSSTTDLDAIPQIEKITALTTSIALPFESPNKSNRQLSF